MSTNLLSFLSKVPDPRGKAGRRHPLPSLLAMVVLGNLSGYYGYRELARFMQRHAWEFVRLFGFKHGVPGHVTIRDVLGKLDFEALQQQFQAWLSQVKLSQVKLNQAAKSGEGGKLLIV
ncbi:MAG TPA: transposase family protein [Cytophagales bacterium]